MRALSLISVLVLVLLSALTLMNLPEVLRPVELNLGWRTLQAPLGLLILGLGAVGLLLALAAALISQTAHARDRQRLQQELRAQRDLADKAETSRYAELQRHMGLQAQAAEHREREMLGHVDHQLEQVRLSLARQLDDVGHSLSAYVGELEDRLERRRLLRPAQASPRSYEPH